jgi:hypothetical protein
MSDEVPERASISKASRAGFHFLSTYQGCRWKWYINHYRHIKPLKVSRYLTFGSAFHAAKEAFYRGEVTNAEDFVYTGTVVLVAERDAYEKSDQYEEDIVKMRVMASKWWETFAADELATYDILAIEEEMNINLPGGFVMTVRPDVVVRERTTGIVYAFETKTTSRSIPEMARSVACQQQVDAQLLGIKGWMTARGMDISTLGGVIPDIVYSRQSVCRAERTTPINRSVKELADAQLSFSGLFAEIGQKVQALDAKEMPPEALFDRNGAWCSQFGCEYEQICRARFTTPPPGYTYEV